MIQEELQLNFHRTNSYGENIEWVFDLIDKYSV